MAARQADLFDRPPRPKLVVRAHFVDVGDGVAFYTCKRCGWDSGWIGYDRPSDVKRGVPCQRCNELDRR